MSNSNKRLTIKDVPALNQPHCKIKNLSNVEDILNDFISGDCNRLQVVTDFDFTITKQRMDDGQCVLSSFGIFYASKSLTPEFIERGRKINAYYRPIEIDPNICVEEKTKYMIEWWKKSAQELVGFEFDLKEIDETAAKYKDSLRDRTHEMFGELNRLNVPCLVFSAGFGHSVVSILKQANLLYPNVKVVSNFLKFKDGLLDGFQDPMIHTFNKNESVLKGTDYYNVVHNRDHIIVIGDSIGDAGMAKGMPASSQVLKIGFLYDHVEENLEKYMDTFDIVLIDDQTMNVPIAILNMIDNK